MFLSGLQRAEGPFVETRPGDQSTLSNWMETHSKCSRTVKPGWRGGAPGLTDSPCICLNICLSNYLLVAYYP